MNTTTPQNASQLPQTLGTVAAGVVGIAALLTIPSQSSVALSDLMVGAACVATAFQVASISADRAFCHLQETYKGFTDSVVKSRVGHFFEGVASGKRSELIFNVMVLSAGACISDNVSRSFDLDPSNAGYWGMKFLVAGAVVASLGLTNMAKRDLKERGVLLNNSVSEDLMSTPRRHRFR